MIWLVVTIAAWGVVHSWLASLGFKDAVRRVFGEQVGRGYRLVYNLFSIVSFAPILVLWRILPDRLLYAVEPPWLYFMLAGQGLSAVALLVAISQTDALALLGLRQITGGQESSELVTDGFYRYVRHPMYLFGLLTIWLAPEMTANTLVAWIALSVYLFVGAYFEEKKLTRVFGSMYSEYRSRTPMIIPLKKRAARRTWYGKA